MTRAYLILGSNEGNQVSLIEKAKWLINEHLGQIISESELYVTEPWGVENQNDYYNQAISISTHLKPLELMAAILQIESKLGRVRGEKYAPRTMDIDILFYDDEIVNEQDLTIPHPRIQERNFVLQPLNDIAGKFVHPVLNKTVRELLLASTDRKEVTILASNEPADSI